MSPWMLVIKEKSVGEPPVLMAATREDFEDGHKPDEMNYQDYQHCIFPLWDILKSEFDANGVPVDYTKIINEKMTYRGEQTLSEEAGQKLSLFFTLAHKSRLPSHCLELMCWRISRFTREEAGYWHAFVCFPEYYGSKRCRAWHIKGLRLMLAGEPRDSKDVYTIIGKLMAKWLKEWVKTGC